jgi:serine/threonine protein kinase
VSASRPSTVQRLAVGDHLEGYTIVGELGEGGFSKVFRVETGFGDTAALKLAKSTSPNPYGGGTVALCFAQPIAFHTGGIGPGSPTPSQVIEREGLMLRGLDDPLFPRVIETGMLADRAFVVYEEIAGETLRARIQRRDPVPIEFFLAIGEALAIRQQDGRLPFHGDLKPDNVMIDDFGNWRLLDPACAAAEGKPLGSRGLITTPSYYPFLMPDDRPALALMIVEAMTGMILVCEDPPYPPQRTSAAFQQWLDTLSVAGRGRYVQALRHMPRLDELSLTMSSELAQVLLKALYLRRGPDGVLDVDPGYLGWSDFLADLRSAIRGGL